VAAGAARVLSLTCYGVSDPKYADTARMSSSVSLATGFFIKAASPPFLVPSLKRYS
jgi:hypothetical protein